MTRLIPEELELAIVLEVRYQEHSTQSFWTRRKWYWDVAYFHLIAAHYIVNERRVS